MGMLSMPGRVNRPRHGCVTGTTSPLPQVLVDGELLSPPSGNGICEASPEPSPPQPLRRERNRIRSAANKRARISFRAGKKALAGWREPGLTWLCMSVLRKGPSETLPGAVPRALCCGGTTSMVSAVLTLFTVVVFVLNIGPAWADLSAEAPNPTGSQSEAQCKPAELTDEGRIEAELLTVATVKVYCQFRIFCPAEHRCCASGPTFWCCPLPATCDSNMDADDWTGCHGAQGVNPL